MFLIASLLAACSYKEDTEAPYDYWEPTSSGEQYNEIIENPFMEVSENPVSTFSIDVDGGSYTNSRRFLNYGEKPPVDAIRTEEFVNYFSYNFPEPENEHPFYIGGEIAKCPWDDSHHILCIGLKGKNIPKDDLPATNFVFLIDVSGSMSSDNKLELLKDCFILFVEELRNEDKVAIVTYAGEAGIVLNSTSCSNKEIIIEAIESLGSGGSTAGAAGINTAYEIAEQNFVDGGNNRVIIGTDGDFNVGMSSQEELIALIEEKRKSGIYLTTLGVGTGNLNEGMLEQLANHGNGNFEYIDNLEQGKKVFIYDFNSFYAIAKDVKIQVTFNENAIKSYRLIGYENRLLNEEDFTDDSKDAGELGSNQTICALYELVAQSEKKVNALSMEVSYKLPTSETSTVFSFDVNNYNTDFNNASENLRFASAVASFALILRDSEYKGDATYNDVINWVQNANSFNPNNYKADLIDLINIAKNL